MFEFKRDQPNPSDQAQNFRVKVLGVGSAGTNIIDRLAVNAGDIVGDGNVDG